MAVGGMNWWHLPFLAKEWGKGEIPLLWHAASANRIPKPTRNSPYPSPQVLIAMVPLFPFCFVFNLFFSPQNFFLFGMNSNILGWTYEVTHFSKEVADPKSPVFQQKHTAWSECGQTFLRISTERGSTMMQTTKALSPLRSNGLGTWSLPFQTSSGSLSSLLWKLPGPLL